MRAISSWAPPTPLLLGAVAPVFLSAQLFLPALELLLPALQALAFHRREEVGGVLRADASLLGLVHAGLRPEPAAGPDRPTEEEPRDRPDVRQDDHDEQPQVLRQAPAEDLLGRDHVQD